MIWNCRKFHHRERKTRCYPDIEMSQSNFGLWQNYYKPLNLNYLSFSPTFHSIILHWECILVSICARNCESVLRWPNKIVQPSPFLTFQKQPEQPQVCSAPAFQPWPLLHASPCLYQAVPGSMMYTLLIRGRSPPAACCCFTKALSDSMCKLQLFVKCSATIRRKEAQLLLLHPFQLCQFMHSDHFIIFLNLALAYSFYLDIPTLLQSRSVITQEHAELPNQDGDTHRHGQVALQVGAEGSCPYNNCPWHRCIPKSSFIFRVFSRVDDSLRSKHSHRSKSLAAWAPDWLDYHRPEAQHISKCVCCHLFNSSPPHFLKEAVIFMTATCMCTHTAQHNVWFSAPLTEGSSSFTHKETDLRCQSLHHVLPVHSDCTIISTARAPGTNILLCSFILSEMME